MERFSSSNNQTMVSQMKIERCATFVGAIALFFSCSLEAKDESLKDVVDQAGEVRLVNLDQKRTTGDVLDNLSEFNEFKGKSLKVVFVVEGGAVDDLKRIRNMQIKEVLKELSQGPLGRRKDEVTLEMFLYFVRDRILGKSLVETVEGKTYFVVYSSHLEWLVGK